MARGAGAVSCAMVFAGALPAVAAAVTFTVNRTDDPAIGAPPSGCSGGVNDCSLRQAIADVNALGGANTIDLPAGTYTLSIPPSGGDDVSSGDLNVTATGGTTTITGAGAASTIVQWFSLATAPDRVFSVASGASASISGLTIQRGQAQGTASGGGILDDGALTLDSAVVTDNASGPTGVSTAPGAGGGGIDVEGTAMITGSTISNNAAGPNRGGGIRLGYGPSPTMTITGSMITGNSATGSGGGIATDGTGMATITGSTVSSNTSGGSATAGDGGGIAEEGGGPVTIDGTTISGNSAGTVGVGGGVSEEGGGAITTSRSTIERNSARNGGGVAQEGGGAVTVSQSTIDANTAKYGGGFAQEGAEPSGAEPAFELVNDTIAGNQATATDYGGGGLLGDGSGTAVLVNSTVANNSAAAGQGGDLQAAGSIIDLTNTIVSGGTPVDCVGSTLFSGGMHGHGTAAGHNLASDSTCSVSGANGDLFPLDPQLAPLANNGGATETMALYTGSPALGAANAGSCPPTDQRGVARGQTLGGGCDIGAFEGSVSAPRTTATAVSCGPNPVLAGGRTQCTVTVTDIDSGASTAPTGSVTIGGSGSCSLAPGTVMGSAGCTVAYTPASGGAVAISASYPGDATHKPSSGSASITVTLRPTATGISCVQLGVVAVGTACTMTVTDTGPAPIFTPTGTVELFGSHAGAVSAVASCTLAPGAAAGTASCTNAQTFGPPDSIYAVYQGDTLHAPSSSRTVDLVRTMITSGPTGFTSSAPQFTFTSSAAGSSFQCSLDGKPFVACVSGVIYYGLAFGPHTFTVRSVAPNGDVDPVGASASFTLGTSTLTFGCSLAVPSYHGPSNPVGVDQEASCDYQAACPALSSCEVTRAAATAEDQQVGFASVYNDGDNFSVHCSTNGETSASWPGCPLDSPLAVPLRFALQISGRCYVDHVIVPAQDADGIGEAFCKVTVIVRPVVPLGVTGVTPGGAVTVFAPSPGKLLVSSPGAPAAQTAASAEMAAGHTRRGPAPTLRPLRVVVRRAGPVTFHLRLSSTAAARLHRRHRLTVRLELTFVPTRGHRVTRLESVTLTTRVCGRVRLPHAHGKRILICR